MPPKPRDSRVRAGHSELPKGWPAGVVYLRASTYSRKIADDTLRALQVDKSGSSPSGVLRRPQGPYPLVKIVQISAESHPANGQCGLFASQSLVPDSFILPYLGFVHDHNETDDQSDYDLSLDRERGVSVDASKMGNEARFINDYRGVGSNPNAEFREAWMDVGNGKVEKRMAVYVLGAGKSGKRAKGIPKGQEILISYGKGFWSERQNGSE
jgi:hypothetical protein